MLRTVSAHALAHAKNGLTKTEAVLWRGLAAPQHRPKGQYRFLRDGRLRFIGCANIMKQYA